MKAYFAKYLPVEGEIKEGEDYWCSVYGYRKNNPASRNILKGNEKFKPVKLFLCSRDIQAGDEISHPHQPYKFNATIANKGIWEGCFKVIGEISKEATWIKEGNEFDEEEVKLFARLPPNQLVSYIPENKELGYSTVIKIKCPTCNTYH